MSKQRYYYKPSNFDGVPMPYICLPADLDTAGLIDITTLEQEGRVYIDPATDRTHDSRYYKLCADKQTVEESIEYYKKEIDSLTFRMMALDQKIRAYTHKG